MRTASLSTRLLVWILPFSLAITCAITLSTCLIAREVILWETQQGIEAVTEAAAAQAKGFFEQRHNDLATISQSPLFKDHYMNVEYGLTHEAEVYRHEIERMLLDLQRRARAYPRLSYVDASGREICVVDEYGVRRPGGRFEPSGFLASVRRLKPRQRYVSPITRVPWHEAPIVRYGTPLVDELGGSRGALIFAVSLKPVYDSLGRLHMGASGRSFLSARRPTGYFEDLPSARRGLLTSAVSIPGTPWAVVTAVERSDFTQRLAWVSTLSFFLALGASALLVLVITRQVRILLRPLEDLVEASEAYAAGDLGARVRVRGPGEVAALADSFNLMADRLKARTEDLLQKVQELTALHRMSDASLRRLGRDAIAKASLEAAVQGLGAECGILYSVEEDAGELVGVCACGLEKLGLTEAQVRLRRFPLAGESPLARAARSRAPVAAEPAAAAADGCRDLAASWRDGLFFAAPITAGKRVIAVVCLGCARAGGRSQADRLPALSIFCAAAGLALENVELLEKVTKSEARYRTAVENSPHAVVGLDQNLRITLWNRRAEALFGYQPTEAFGRSLDVLFGEETYRRLLRRLETEGSIRHAEAAGSARDGRPLDLTLSWTGQNAGPGGVREWFVVLEDETEKRHLQSQLIQAEKMTAVGNLIAGIAHELNNPLAAVTGYADILQEVLVQPDEAEDLRQLRQSALRCRDIVVSLLLFARQDKAERHKLDLNDVVRSALALVEYRIIKTEGISLEVELDPAGPEAAGDFRRLQQVLINLLCNACDALRGQLGPRVIRLRTRSLEDGSEAVVEDNGPGIPPERRPFVFRPFYTTKPVGQGTGLGLYVSAQIVQDSGGVLGCAEGSDGGARFTASFPPCPADLPRPEQLLQLPPATPGRRVLVVDDEPSLVQLMSRMLTEDGLVVAVAGDLETALRKVMEEGLDLVITDVDLGPSKGIELVETLRGLPRCPALIFVTGDVLNQQLGEQLAQLEVPVLSKPFLRTEFLRLVRRTLGRKRRPS